MQKTEISWTDMSWNPVRGCTKVSPGCKHCYAETFAERWRGIPGNPYEQGFDLRLVPEKLTEPLTWRKPKRIFVNSMSDLFHEEIPDAYVSAVFGSMRLASWHVFQVLTKRAERMEQWASSRFAAHSNVWLGVSVENRKHGLPRIDHLRRTPAAVRFLSIEPLLEDLGEINLTGIHWVICGGESGPKARPMRPEWAWYVRDQCAASGVPFFFKQWGDWVEHDQLPPDEQVALDAAEDGILFTDEKPVAPLRVRGKRGGRLLDGVLHDEMPEWTAKPFPGVDEQRLRQAEADAILERAREVAKTAGWQPGQTAEVAR